MGDLTTVLQLESWRERLIKEERASAHAAVRSRPAATKSSTRPKVTSNYMPPTTLTQMLSKLGTPDARVSAMQRVPYTSSSKTAEPRGASSIQTARDFCPKKFPDTLRSSASPAWSAAVTPCHPQNIKQRPSTQPSSSRAGSKHRQHRQEPQYRASSCKQQEWDLALATLRASPPPTHFNGRRSNWR